MAAVHIVVMFTDLVGSTELSSRLTPADADSLRQAHFACLRRAVAELGGREVKNLGDGLMVVFPSASAALACAVTMQQAVHADRSSREPLAVRIGISAGEAVLEDGDYFGEPVVEAARLCATARGGQILAADLVRITAGRRMTQAYVPLGDLELKGLPDPVTTVDVAWEPVAADEHVPLPDRLAALPPVGFFGRGNDLGLLDDAFKAVTAGERRVVLLCAEPGMGKTTLCGEFARAAHAQGAVVLYGRCDEELGIPYQPFVEALGHFITHAPNERLTAHVGEHGGELAALVPGLAQRLGSVPPAGSDDPETQRFLLFAAVLGVLASGSASEPLVVVLDDLHWADKPTLTLLRYVVGRSLPANLLILGTYRQHEITRTHPLAETLAALHREAGVSRVALTGLGDGEVMALMESSAGHELSGSFVDLAHALRRETDGNPFFVVQLLRHLAEGGWLFQDDTGQWRARSELADITLPETVREVVGHRVARLGEESDQLLSTAAVIGQDFDADVLAPVAGLTEPEMVEILDRAVRAGLLTDLGRGRYSFAHAVVQHAVYEALTASRRSLLHRRVAETLEAVYGEGPGPRVGEVARHWLATTRPSDAGKALDYARWAGEAALAALAPEEAIRSFTNAVELAAEHCSSDDHLRAELLIGLGSAQRLAGDAAFRETFLAAAQLAEAIGDHDQLVRSALANNRGTFSSSGVVDQERVAVLQAALAATSGDSAERARLLATQAVELTFAGDWPSRRRLADEALSVARRVADPTTFISVAGLLYFCLQVPETLDERLGMTAEAVALAERQSDPLLVHWAHRWRLYACSEAGDIDAVDRHLPEMLRYAQACRVPNAAWAAAWIRSWRACLAGDLGESEALAVESFQIGTEGDEPEAAAVLGFQLWQVRRQQDRLEELEESLAVTVEQDFDLPVGRALLSSLYCEIGKIAEARQLFAADSADGFELFPYDLFWLLGLATYAEVCVVLEEHQAALDLYRRLAPWGGQVTAVSGAAGDSAVALQLGMLATFLGRFDDAETHFAEALAIHERLRAPHSIARTQLEHARMLLARAGAGDTARATELLGQVEATAERYRFAALTRHASGLRL